jgi:hypothetical protein
MDGTSVFKLNGIAAYRAGTAVKIPVKSFLPGIYLLLVKDNAGLYSQKIVIFH